MQKIILFTNRDWHFYDHLLPIAIRAKESGNQVCVMTQFDAHKSKIVAHGFDVIDVKIKRNSINLFSEVALLCKIIIKVWRYSPDILQNFTIKPILYGSIASTILRTKKVINTFLGMGTIFTYDKKMSWLKLILSQIVSKALRLVLAFKCVIFVTQNEDDANLLLDLGLLNVRKQCSVGVQTDEFKFNQRQADDIVFALVARVIAEKGVREYVKAAQKLAEVGIKARCLLIGPIDLQSDNPITRDEIAQYKYVEYLGAVDNTVQNIQDIWDKADIAVLPSYREGLSRSLLEAAACGKAIITTDAPGGRELIAHNVTGLLVKPRDYDDLFLAMYTLATNKDLAHKFGSMICEYVKEHYDAKVIAAKMELFYKTAG